MQPGNSVNLEFIIKTTKFVGSSLAAGLVTAGTAYLALDLINPEFILKMSEVAARTNDIPDYPSEVKDMRDTIFLVFSFFPSMFGYAFWANYYLENKY